MRDVTGRRIACFCFQESSVRSNNRTRVEILDKVDNWTDKNNYGFVRDR